MCSFLSALSISYTPSNQKFESSLATDSESRLTFRSAARVGWVIHAE